MTPKERAAMQQALEALEEAYENGFLTGVTGLKTIDTITALREALAKPDIEEMTLTQIAARHEQAEQEPVAVISESAIGLVKLHSNGVSLPFDTPLYAAPVRTKDLTDGAIWEILETYPTDIIKAIRAVIAADREKNK